MKTIAAPGSLRQQSLAARRIRPQASSLARAGFRPAGIVLAIAAVFIASPDRAAAQATGAQVIHGQATLVQQGNSLVITTQNGAGTSHSAINWQSFSVPAGSTTQFNQPNAGSTSINRVLGNDPSAIYGTLSSNGRLVLVNPSGIAVGAGAVVDTAGFTASTLRMSDADALAGRLVFGGDGLGGGALALDGRILARSGDVVLIAPDLQVGSQALIQAPNGATLLAAGRKVELTGRGLEGIRLEVQAPSDRAVNLGTLQGDAVGIFAGQLKHSGLIQATAASAAGGRVVLKAAGGDSLVDGQITALGAAGQGGGIEVLGQRVGLLAGASLDASGESGGGQIRVGGDYQGKNAEVPNAQRTYVDANATLKADATVNGDGGRIIVWADDQTQSAGAISARGGAQGGDGGFVEVSGKHKLQFASAVDTRAPMGKIGTLLLDPDFIDVANSPASSTTLSDVDLFVNSPGTVTLNPSVIDGATTNVILQANNDINFIDPVSITTTGVSLTAQAGGLLYVNAPITTQGGAVFLSAGDTGASPQSESHLYVNANIDTTGGGTAPAGAAVTLKSRLSDLGGNSVYIASPIAINAGTAGAVDISGQRIDISGAAISGGSIAMSTGGFSGSIHLGGVSLDAKSGGISVGSSGADAPISISGSSLMASGSGGISATSDASSVDISSSSLTTAGGNVAMSGGAVTPASSNDAAYLYDVAVDAGSGSISISGKTQGPNSFGVHIAGPTMLTAGGGTTVYGQNQAPLISYSGGGILADCDCSDALTGVGSLSLTGKSSDAGYGVHFSFADIRRSGGGLAIDGSSTSGYGVNIYSSNIVMSDASNVSLKGSSPSGFGSGVDLSYSAIQTTGGAVSLASTDAGVNLSQTAIDTYNGNISIAGGNASYASVGISIQGLSGLRAGAGAVNMVGESGAYEGFVFDMGETASSATATISGSTVDIRGSTSSGTSAALRVGGTFGSALISATSSAQLTAVGGNLAISNATIQNSGSGLTVLEAVATAPSQSAPAISIDSLSTVQNAGGTGDIHLAADSIYLDGLINSGAARTMFTPSTTSRAISLGGTDETGKLNLTQAELDKVTAGVIVVGGGAYSGGLTIDSPIAIAGAPGLSLIQGGSATIGQSSGATLTANQLNADAGSVTLKEANNVQVLSGHANDTAGTGFVFSNDGGADLTVGTADGMNGVVSGTGETTRMPVWLSAGGGKLLQTQVILGSTLSAGALGDVVLTNSGNNLTSFGVSASAGSVALGNSNTGSTRLAASAAGTVGYKGSGEVVIDSITAGSAATGSGHSSAAVGVEAASIAAGKPALIDATSNGSVYLNAVNGGIGSGSLPLAVNTGGGAWLQSAGTGADIYLATPNSSFMVGNLKSGGAASITGPGAGTLDLRNASAATTLDWKGFDSATLGSGGGMVSAGGVIGAGSDVFLAGILAPGGIGSISSMNVSGDFNVLAGSTMKFDFNGTSHDNIAVSGNVVLPSASAGSSVIADASVQPAAGSYTLISGATTGDLPTLSGSVTRASLAYGSLVLNVAPPPPPVSALDEIKLILGDPSLPPPEDPVTTFLSLFTQETDKPKEDGAPAPDSVVDDNQCRR